MNSEKELFGTFPTPSRSDWLTAGGSEFVKDFEAGLHLPALVSRDDDTVVDRTALLARCNQYAGASSVRMDCASTSADTISSIGARQVGLTQIPNPSILAELKGLAGLHLRVTDAERAVHLAEKLPEGLEGTLVISDPTGYDALATLLNDNFVPQPAHFRTVGIDLSANRACQHSVVTRAALACAWAHHLIKQLEMRYVSPARVARQLHFVFPISNSFWKEVAFLRAVRVLLNCTTQALDTSIGIAESVLTVRPATEQGEHQPERNLIRYSSLASAAVIGGADMISAAGLTVRSGATDMENQRLLVSTQLAIVHESLIAANIDAAAGSYYCELLTLQIARAAWTSYSRLGERLDRAPPTVLDLERTGATAR